MAAVLRSLLAWVAVSSARAVLIQQRDLAEALLRQPPCGAGPIVDPGNPGQDRREDLTEIGDINRFPTSGHLAAYAGLAPVTRQSGSSIAGEHKSRPATTVTNAFWLSAFCSLHHEPSKVYYARKRSEGKRHNAAIVCLPRRRCDVIHAMLRNGTVYDDQPRPARPAPVPELPLAA